MFDATKMREIYDDERTIKALTKLIELEKHLSTGFYKTHDAIRAMILAVATRSSVLFVGPPGVAKSQMVRRLCTLTGVLQSVEAKGSSGEIVRRGDYFEYLLSPFTEPTELFGGFKLESLKAGVERMERYDDNMIHNCRVVFLDEIFNASNAILNALLALMNERLFHDRGEIKRARLQTLFAATNQIPTDTGLRAVYDRLVIRCPVNDVDPEPAELNGLMDKAWQHPPDVPADGALDGLFEAVEEMNTQVLEPARPRLWNQDPDNTDLKALTYIVNYAKKVPLGSFSNRRIVKIAETLVIQRLLRAVREGSLGDPRLNLSDLEIVWTYFLDDTERLEADHVSHFESVYGLLKRETAA